MFRLFFVAFLGEPRTEKAKHAHESPWVMTGPLVVLSVLAVVGGFIGITTIYNSQFAPDAEKLTVAQQLLEPLHNIVPMLLGIGAVAVGLFAAYTLYGKTDSDPLPAKLGGLATAMKNRFYFDELYEATFIRLHDGLAAVADFIDRWLVEGLCIGFIRGGTDLSGRTLRLLQTGNLQTYAFLFTLGVAVVLYLMLGK